MGEYLDLPASIELATFLHRGQSDKAGFPYIKHPLRVLQNVQDQGLPPYVQIAAVFHDSTEDTKATPEILLGLGVSPPAVTLVVAMDRDIQKQRFIDLGNPQPNPNPMQPETYREWKRDKDIYYYRNLLEVPYGPDLKRADMKDNSLKWRVAYLSPSEQQHNKEKYEFAEWVLSGEPVK